MALTQLLLAAWTIAVIGSFCLIPPSLQSLPVIGGRSYEMSRQVTEMDFRMPQFRHEKVEDYEFRDDGQLVRKDRWISGMQMISSIMGNRGGFEISDVVDQVRALKGDWNDAEPEEDPGHDRIDVRLSCGSVLAGCDRAGAFTYQWPVHALEFTSKDFGVDVIEWKVSATHSE